MSQKVAIVTGSNKGIGFAIVRGLCKDFKGEVYLTARDTGRGEEAVKELKKESLTPRFHQLDVTNRQSIEKLGSYMKEKYGGIDILVNNAGIAYKAADTTPFKVQAPETMKVNYFGLHDVCEVLFPLLRPGARVVHVASMAGEYSFKKLSAPKKDVAKKAKTIGEVTDFMQSFVKDAEAEIHEKKGWPNSGYGMTKLGVIMSTPIQQQTMDENRHGEDILINSCCPGYVDTDMSSHKGHLTIDQGAETPLYLALLAPKVTSPKGEFCKLKKVVDWRQD